ncbi:MAG: hypothetical protein IK066_09950, partial [Kiritimatiellae bacterium]|nr:hypothetical protein [Kiritimatiellia bacterium]
AILALARLLGTCATLAPHLRHLARANHDLAFGDTLTPREKSRIHRKSLQNFALVLLDLFWFAKDSRDRIARHVTIAPSLQRAVDFTGPLVGVTGHFGNWELVGRTFGMTPRGILSVAKPLKNPAVDRLLRQAREDTGQRIVERDGALKKLIRCLRSNGLVGLLLDQNTKPEEGGVFVPWFGTPATISPAAARLASATGADIAFAPFLPAARGDYLGEASGWLTAAEIATLTPDAIDRRIAHFYETAIRLRPECWLWAYKRWRWIPPDTPPTTPFPYYAKPLQPPSPPPLKSEISNP